MEELMKALMNIVGVILIIFGIISLGYQGFTYTQREKVAEIGDVQITSENEKNFHIPPIVGGLAFAAGIIIIVFNRRK
jgi:ascorbate-specific PTS system EIIC-type component UlaA